jgi:hypothetical protein
MSQDDLLTKVDILLKRHATDVLLSSDRTSVYPGNGIDPEIPTLTEVVAGVSHPNSPVTLQSNLSGESSTPLSADEIPVLTEVVPARGLQDEPNRNVQERALAETKPMGELLEERLVEQLTATIQDRVAEHTEQFKSDIERWVRECVKKEIEAQTRKAPHSPASTNAVNTGDPDDRVN